MSTVSIMRQTDEVESCDHIARAFCESNSCPDVNKWDTVLRPELANLVATRCGEQFVSDGLQCPYCGADEAYKAAADPRDVDKWVFVIRAFRVDDASECMNCRRWFTL